MKTLLKLMLTGWTLTAVAVAAEPNGGALRNLAWAATTLAKVETDLGEIVREPQGPEAAALAAAVAEAHTRLAALKQVVATADAESESLGKAADFAKNLAGLAQWTIDRTGDLAGKQATRRKIFEERTVLAKTDFGKQLDDVLLALASCSVRQAAAQLAEKQVAVVEAEAVWNLQALRFDQLVDEADNEAGWLERKAELQDAVRESGKQIKLAGLESARDKVRTARLAQQQLALEKQQLVNRTAQLNLQAQALDEKGGQLNEATDRAREAFDEAQGKVQEALDE
jgi:hypothetical protein